MTNYLKTKSGMQYLRTGEQVRFDCKVADVQSVGTITVLDTDASNTNIAADVVVGATSPIIEAARILTPRLQPKANTIGHVYQVNIPITRTNGDIRVIAFDITVVA